MTGLDGEHEIFFLSVLELIILLARGFHPHYYSVPVHSPALNPQLKISQNQLVPAI